MITFTDRAGRLVIAAVEYADAADKATFLEACAVEGRPALRHALDELDARERAFQAAVTPEQAAIGWGDYFAATYPPAHIPGMTWTLPGDGPVTVYGRIWTLDEFKRRERAAAGSAREYRGIVRHALAAYDRGWRHGDVCSAVEPQAPPDDTHVAVMRKITRADYEQAIAGFGGTP